MRLEGQKLGNYHVSRLLGEGGMGQVYLAQDTKLHREVAIKVLHEDKATDPALQTRFQREMEAIATLSNPHIIPIYAVDEQSVNNHTIDYMVMPYKPDGSLAQWLQQRQRRGALPSPPDVAYLIEQAADALQYAHDKDILHRDIKPSNFLIESLANPDRPTLLLTDFGLVKDLQDGKLTSMGIGTPQYMAPELMNEQPTKASDQYALAIMTYELLTGQVPFQGTRAEIAIQHFKEKPQPPSNLNHNVSKATDAVVLRALAKKPSARYPSIRAYASALQQSVSKQPSGGRQQTPQPKPAQPELAKVGRGQSGSMPSFPPLLRPNGESTATLMVSRKEAMNGGLKLLAVMDGMNKKNIHLSMPGGIASGENLRYALPKDMVEGLVLYAEDPTTSVLTPTSRSLLVNFQVVEQEQPTSKRGQVIAGIVILLLLALALFFWAWSMGYIPHV